MTPKWQCNNDLEGVMWKMSFYCWCAEKVHLFSIVISCSLVLKRNSYCMQSGNIRGVNTFSTYGFNLLCHPFLLMKIVAHLKRIWNECAVLLLDYIFFLVLLRKTLKNLSQDSQSPAKISIWGLMSASHSAVTFSD